MFRNPPRLLITLLSILIFIWFSSVLVHAQSDIAHNEKQNVSILTGYCTQFAQPPGLTGWVFNLGQVNDNGCDPGSEIEGVPMPMSSPGVLIHLTVSSGSGRGKAEVRVFINDIPTRLACVITPVPSGTLTVSMCSDIEPGHAVRVNTRDLLSVRVTGQQTETGNPQFHGLQVVLEKTTAERELHPR